MCSHSIPTSIPASTARRVIGVDKPDVGQAVTSAQIKTFAENRLNMAQASIVIVGDGRKFLTALRQKYPATEVIPIADLDLNRATLRKP